MATAAWQDTTTEPGFKPDTGGVALGDELDAPTDFHFSETNFSQHADPDADTAYFAEAHDGGCNICHEPGHFARDCPDKPTNSGECYNCGEVGHNKADCPNPRVEREFTGTCRTCNQVGHRAAECPEKKPMLCRACNKEGHVASECSENRFHTLFAALNVEEPTAEKAWADLKAADKSKDIEAIKQAVIIYAKVVPDIRFAELEQTFRDITANTYLIAKQQEVADTHTIVDLQGKAGQKYVVSFQFTDKPRRVKFAEGWPASPEDNLTRLEEAGFVMDGLVMKCRRCGEIGHSSKTCEQEASTAGKVAIMCANCGEEGHRVRDCKEKRKGNGCRNCGSEDHIAKECPEPRSDIECRNCSEKGHFSKDCPNREPDVCRNCGEEGHRARDCDKERVVKCNNCDGEGHFAKECPEPKNPAKMKCRNCDEMGHMSRECPKPTDWSRVQCSNCKEFGHSYKRCKQPPAEEPEGNGGWDEKDGAAASSGSNWQANKNGGEAATEIAGGTW